MRVEEKVRFEKYETEKISDLSNDDEVRFGGRELKMRKGRKGPGVVSQSKFITFDVRVTRTRNFDSLHFYHEDIYEKIESVPCEYSQVFM